MNDDQKSPYYDKLQRLLKIINLIENKNGLNRKKLSRLCGDVSRKTISRDINTLRELGYEIVFDNESGYQFLDKEFIRVSRNFTSLEALVLILSLRANEGLPEEFRIQLESKLLSIFPSSVKRDLDEMIETSGLSLNKDGKAVAMETLKKIEKAVETNRKIKFDYTAADSPDQSKLHKVVPYALVWRRDRNYLIGDLEYRDYSPINYRLDRIRNIRLLSEFGEIPDDFALENYLDSSWRMFGGKEQFVKIKFDKEAKHVFENRLGGKLENNLEKQNNEFVYSGYIRGLEGLKTDLLGLGAHAEVLEPDHLREEVIEQANNLVQSYSN